MPHPSTEDGSPAPPTRQAPQARQDAGNPTRKPRDEQGVTLSERQDNISTFLWGKKNNSNNHHYLLQVLVPPSVEWGQKSPPGSPHGSWAGWKVIDTGEGLREGTLM